MKAYFALLLVAVLGMGCVEEKGPAERAGEKLDNAMESVEDAANEVEEEIENNDP